MTGGRPIGEEDLHGYVDFRLDPERRARVERYLADHPEAAARLRGWQAGDAALRAALDPVASEPVPAALGLARLVEARYISRWAPRRMAAGIALALAVGAGGGWMARGPTLPTGVAAVGLEAASAYGVFATDDTHPVEFGPGQQAQLVSWAAQRLGRPVAPPDLSASGYGFMGGRVIATPAGAGCMFLYGDGHGGRISLFVRPMHGRDENAPMRPVTAGDAAGYAWARGGLGYGLVSDRSSPSLHALSDRVRDAMGGRI